MLAKAKLIEVLISRALFYSHISPNGIVSVNNVLKVYDVMKEEIKNSNTR